MRIFSATALVLLLLLPGWGFAGADYAREKKWADEVLPGIVVGDPVYLELRNAHKFLTLYTEARDARAALVIVHGIGIHPDWNMIGTLRSQLAEQGYTTLSIQMPVLGNEAIAEEYLPLFPEAEERIDVAVEFLKAKGYRKVGIVSHSMGSAMSWNYVAQHQDKLFAWAALGIGQNFTYKEMQLPVLDLYGEHDLPPVLKMAGRRGGTLKGKPLSRQVRVPRSDHFFSNHEADMVREVREFLGSIK